jgi:hypothetical protein
VRQKHPEGSRTGGPATIAPRSELERRALYTRSDRRPPASAYDQAVTGRSCRSPSTQTSTLSSKKAISPAIFGCSGIGNR